MTIAAITEEWVLITADDRLPRDHGALAASLKVTVATVDPRRGPGFGIDEWRREVVHRWAHAIAGQAPSSIRRYSATANRAWTMRRR